MCWCAVINNGVRVIVVLSECVKRGWCEYSFIFVLFLGVDFDGEDFCPLSGLLIFFYL